VTRLSWGGLAVQTATAPAHTLTARQPMHVI
jgi:hypothetical protein